MKIKIISLIFVTLFITSSTLTQNVFAQEIPGWIKNNAAWWAEDQIDDTAFLQGIQFLIANGILVIPPTELSGTSDTKEIPGWIKNNAAWWAEDQIDDGTFVSGIQFLIKNEILSVEQEAYSDIVKSQTTTKDANEIKIRAAQFWDSYFREFQVDHMGTKFAEITYYEIHDGQLVFSKNIEVSEELQVYQNDVAKHQEIWNQFYSITPKQYIDDVIAFGINIDETSSASAARDLIHPSQFLITFNILEAYPNGSFDEEYVKGTFIHELGHIISLGATQTDNDLELSLLEQSDNYDDLFEQKVENCNPRFYDEYFGCMNSDSYMNKFFQKFWTDIYDEFVWEDETDNPEQYQILLDAFYTKYENQFISHYASTHPSEDFAESFAAFVLTERPQDSSIYNQKILFFYDYPELVETRGFIRENL